MNSKEENRVQQALPWSTGRRNKLVLGGIAALGASVIAVNPIATSPALIEAQHRAVQLVADATASPLDVYGELVNNTITNIGTLGEQLAANPFPVLSTIAANQQGYAEQIGTAIEAIPSTLQNWYENGGREGSAGKVYVAAIQSALQSGDFFTAYDNFNKFFLFALQNSVLPVFNVLFTIPPQMAQNFANAVTAVSSAGTLVYGLFQSAFAPLSGAAFEGSRVSDAISSALSSGDIEGAITGLVNAPGIVANAFLNGFDYNEGDTTEAWSGLFSPKGTRASGGPISQLLVTIPQKIAAAIANSTATTVSTTGAAVVADALSPVGDSAASGAVETSVTDISAGTDAADAAETAAASKAVTSKTTKAALTAKTATDADTEDATAASATDVAATTATEATESEEAKPAKAESSTQGKPGGSRLSSAAKKLGEKIKGTKSKGSKNEAGSGDTGGTSAKKSTKSQGKHPKKESSHKSAA
ncbi:hypothetical protein AWB98_10355 [Mycolicibacterium conceptionense]|uniref:PE-PGRS family protein n=1 Tax=Mycolicibacterium conceptionense TaxID=451644 RepID=A0ABX3VD53_9MYCO|nr:hypothetical protein AWB98_10355 [Mycolicibacterium conceptionense]